MDGLFLNQKTNNIQILDSLKYKHSKKISLQKNNWYRGYFCKEKLLLSCWNSFIWYRKIMKFNIFKLWVFSFNSYIYYLTSGFNASTRTFNLLTRAFNLATRNFWIWTRNLWIELVTHGFELITCGFELVTRALLFHTWDSWIIILK